MVMGEGEMEESEQPDELEAGVRDFCGPGCGDASTTTVGSTERSSCLTPSQVEAILEDAPNHGRPRAKSSLQLIHIARHPSSPSFGLRDVWHPARSVLMPFPKHTALIASRRLRYGVLLPRPLSVPAAAESLLPSQTAGRLELLGR